MRHFLTPVLVTLLLCSAARSDFEPPRRGTVARVGVFGQSATAESHSFASAGSYAAASSVAYSTREAPVVVSVKREPKPPVNVTERVRGAVLEADVALVAGILQESFDVSALARGFTFSQAEREALLFESEKRERDPDVVALKGMATAALDTSDMACKLTEIFIQAVYGEDFDKKLCPEKPEQTYVGTYAKTLTVTKSSSTKVTNSSGTFVHHEGPETQTKSWEGSLVADGLDFDWELEAIGSTEAEDQGAAIPECFNKEEMRQIRENLKQDFEDLELMTSIIEGIPELEVRSSRSLLVIGSPVNTWFCAACWKKRFCNKHCYWCPQK